MATTGALIINEQVCGIAPENINDSSNSRTETLSSAEIADRLSAINTNLDERVKIINVNDTARTGNAILTSIKNQIGDRDCACGVIRPSDHNIFYQMFKGYGACTVAVYYTGSTNQPTILNL